MATTKSTARSAAKRSEPVAAAQVQPGHVVSLGDRSYDPGTLLVMSRNDATALEKQGVVKIFGKPGETTDAVVASCRELGMPIYDLTE